MAATIYDGVEELKTLISTNWTASNTGSVTPNIGKVTDYPPNFQFADGKGYVLVYSIDESEQMPGIGETTTADVNETIRIDIRVFDNETRFKQYKTELRRILYGNRIEPTTNYCILETSGKLIQNLSNKQKKSYREIRDVDMIANNRSMTT